MSDILDADLTQLTQQAEGCSRLSALERDGLVSAPLLLQIVSVIDAGAPARMPASSGHHRLLRLQLTDGVSQRGAFEFRSLGDVAEAQLLPGAKLRIKSGARLAGGMLLLDPLTVEWLGGHVKHLADAWHLQKLRRETDANANATNAPKFAECGGGPLETVPNVRVAAPVKEPAVIASPLSRLSVPTRQPQVPEAPAAPRAPAAAAAAAAAAAGRSARAPKPVSTSGLNPGMVDELLAAGLSLSEIHVQLGLPPPPPECGATKAAEGAPRGARCMQTTPRQHGGRPGKR
jgi:hypothetical protein